RKCEVFQGQTPDIPVQSGPEQECDVNVTIFGRLNITGADMAECSWLVSCEGSMAEYSALKKAFACRLNVVKNTPRRGAWGDQTYMADHYYYKSEGVALSFKWT
ncbi:TPA: hypothetical protein ACXE0C_004713, partial [Escherichia coli]